MFNLKLTFIVLVLFHVLTYSQSGWTLQTVNTEYNINFLSYKDTAICQLAAKENQRFFISTNGTATWQEVYVFAYGYNDIQFLNAFTGFLLEYQTNQITIEKTNNSGLSWSVVHTFYIGTGTYRNIYFIDLLTGYVWENSTGAKTVNGGSNWTSVSFSGVSDITDMCFVNSNTGFINGKNSSFTCLAKTTNQGTSWDINNISSFCKKIQFADSVNGFALCDNSVLLKTTNSGSNWNSIVFQPAENLLSMSVIDRDNCYILSQSGKIFKTSNAGVNWMTQILPAAGLSVREVEFANPDYGIVLCSGGKILKTTTGGLVLGLNQTSYVIPEKFFISRNFPNPFNPVTNINFDISKSCLVEIIVYNSSGREIDVLVYQQLTPGGYNVSWNADAFPSGVYFYKFIAGVYTETNKMVLIK